MTPIPGNSPSDSPTTEKDVVRAGEGNSHPLFFIDTTPSPSLLPIELLPQSPIVGKDTVESTQTKGKSFPKGADSHTDFIVIAYSRPLVDSAQGYLLSPAVKNRSSVSEAVNKALKPLPFETLPDVNVFAVPASHALASDPCLALLLLPIPHLILSVFFLFIARFPACPIPKPYQVPFFRSVTGRSSATATVLPVSRALTVAQLEALNQRLPRGLFALCIPSLAIRPTPFCLCSCLPREFLECSGNEHQAYAMSFGRVGLVLTPISRKSTSELNTLRAQHPSPQRAPRWKIALRDNDPISALS